MTSASENVHQCLFCPQQFNSGSNRDDHILEIIRVICTNCNQNLIRIGRNLYGLHNEVTCNLPSNNNNESILTDQKSQLSAIKLRLRSYRKSIQHVEIKTEVDSDNENNNITQNHILGHFTQEKCVNCNRDLVRIGINLYELHSRDVCRRPSKDRNETLGDQTTETNGIKCELKEYENEIQHIEIKSEILNNEQNVLRTLDEGLKNGRRKCDTCGKSYTHPSTLRAHIISKHGIIGYKFCKSCVCVFNTDEEVVQHMSKCRKKKKKKGPNTFECYMCKAPFKTRPKCAYHMKWKHEPNAKKFKCNQCGLRFFAKWLLTQHHKYVHLSLRKFLCNICGGNMRTKDELVSHMNRHTGDKSYKCTHDGCDKEFRTRSTRDSHIRRHTGKKPYRCKIDDCEERFFDNTGLKRHKESIHGIFIKTFSCTMCNEKFPRSSLLKRHAKSHDPPKRKRGRKRKLFLSDLIGFYDDETNQTCRRRKILIEFE